MAEHTKSTDSEIPPVVAEPEAVNVRKRFNLPSVFLRSEKIAILILVFAMTFVGPAAASIYYPSLQPLARDLHVSSTKISLTITAYMVCQAIFPLLIGGLSDEQGRRPVLIVSLIVGVAINIGLARQRSFIGLLVLRCIQSCAGGSVSVVSMAVVNDILRPTERKEYRVYTSVGYSIAPIISPLIGGILVQLFSWPSIFYFLAAVSVSLLLLVATVLPETCRGQVGNGSIPPKRWNRPMVNLLRSSPARTPDYDTCMPPKRRSTILQTIQLIGKKHIFPLILVQGIVFGGSMAIIITVPLLFAQKFHFTVLEIGATHVSYALGGFTSRWIFGPLLGANSRRHKRLAEECRTSESGSLSSFSVERVRLQVILPTIYLGSAFVLLYGWVLHYNLPVSGPIVVLFFLGNCLTAARTQLTGLILILHPHQPASALAAMNSFRYICGAGAAAAMSG